MQRFAHQGMDADEIISFLEGSFGAFQQMQLTQGWRWDRRELERAIENLERHKLIQRKDDKYRLTELGKLSGESGIEVETITRLVDALTPVNPNDITEETIIAASQVAVELDQVYFPINKTSTQKEPSYWPYQLQSRHIPAAVLGAMRENISERNQPILRAKRAVACLLWMTDLPILELERLMLQFGGGSNSASGSIRAVRSRTVDLVPVVVRVAELIHPNFTFGSRTGRLVARLEIGVPQAAAELAVLVGSRLSRAEYFILINAGKCTIASIESSSDEDILACFDGQQNKKQILVELRRAVRVHNEKVDEEIPFLPIIPPYESSE